MVQKEVRKKTKIYGTVAVLSAIILVTFIYSFGAIPTVFPPNQMPTVAGMKSFSSLQELKTFLVNNSQGGSSFGGGPLDSKFFGFTSPKPQPMPASAPNSLGVGEAAPAQTTTDTSDHSTTNIQVAGVDEADTVKTDGSYIYTLSSIQPQDYYMGYYPQTKNEVCILNADPQNPHVVAKINLGNETEPAGLFLSENGNRLVVLASKYQTFGYGKNPYPVSDSGGFAMPMLMSYQADVYTFINVYDVSNKADPVLTRNFTVSGSYFNSRMIGNYVYVVVSQPAAVYNNVVSLPAVYEGNSQHDVNPSSIYYADMMEPSYLTYTGFYGVSVMEDSEQPTDMTVMMGDASVMYVSPSNIYVTYPNWDQTGGYTSIYRVSVNGSQLTFEANGSVPGNVLNQYSMDEYNGFFRIATNWYSTTQMNNVYVLDSSLNIIGKLEGLAQNENLHAVRFMGDKVYLVTFKKTDPLFVIDLSQPENLKVLGELKIPGYSDYLHPYDQTHLIGVGKEAVDAEELDFAWYQGVKLALFDVTNMHNPVQLANYVIGDRGTDSPVLTDPKAFLFDKEKNLLVIPVSLALVDNSTLQRYGESTASAYGQTVWQGAYVFGLTIDGGFTLKGTVTHLDPASLNSQGHLSNYFDYWGTQNQWITRSLFIGNTLYTISNAEVKLNSLTDMSQIAQINLI